jgi:hypothetical protein
MEKHESNLVRCEATPFTSILLIGLDWDRHQSVDTDTQYLCAKGEPCFAE